MFALKSQPEGPRLHRFMLLRLIALAVPLALGACDGAENPIAPSGTDEPTAPVQDLPATAGEAGPLENVLATGQRIVFTSFRNGSQGDLYKMTPQGTSLTPLTSSVADNDVEPAWSPDNKRIALVRLRPIPSNPYHSEIYVIDADGGNGHWALSQPFPYDLSQPSWAPDGSRLVLTIRQSGKPYLAGLLLATGQVRFVTRGGVGVQGYYPSYNPSGNKIIYVGPNSTTVEQVSTDGAVHKVLVSSAVPVGKPTLSPDGKKVAYSKVVNGNEEIFVKNLVTGTATRLTKTAGVDLLPTWSPDGSLIAFVSQRTGYPQIFTMNPQGGDVKRITKTESVEWYPAWSH
jgi:Tol biopolymer transport system component